MISSRLVEYEMSVRLSALGLARSHTAAFRALLSRVALLELSPVVLARALEPFPTPVRTLDALHLSAAQFMRAQRQPVELASYDSRMLDAARALGLPLSRYCP